MKGERITRKELYNGYREIYALPAYVLNSIQSFIGRTGYMAGMYGWNCDVLSVDGSIAITTGYRPVGKELDSDKARAFDEEFRGPSL